MVFLVVKVNLSWEFGEIRSAFPNTVAAVFESIVGSLTSTEDCEWWATLA